MEKSATRKRFIFIPIALMLFALFFGAGNLIFPASLGQKSGTALNASMTGFLLTAAGLPLICLIAIALSKSKDLFIITKKIHPAFGYGFTTILYLTIGPLFAIPRTGTVSYNIGVLPLLSQNSTGYLALFLALFFALSLWLALDAQKLVNRIGGIMTPVLLTFLLILIFLSLYAPLGYIQAPVSPYDTRAFLNGFLSGYETMDALASLVFGSIVIESIRKYGSGAHQHLTHLTSGIGLFAVLLLGIIYIFIAHMGGQTTAVLGISENGAPILSYVAQHYLGNWGNVLLAVIVFLACLTTSIGLLSACARYFNQICPRISYKHYLYIFTGIAFAIGILGLEAILTASVYLLLFLYPVTIILSLLLLAQKIKPVSTITYLSTLGAVTLTSLISVLDKNLAFIPSALSSVLHWIPYYESGFLWLPAGIAGFIAGLIYEKIKKQNPIIL